MRVFTLALLSLSLLSLSLGGCMTADKTGSLADPVQSTAAIPASEAYDDVQAGKNHFRAGRFGLAELHFRRATEASSGNALAKDAEAWLGLAASYDQLKRFELADRAYKKAQEIMGSSAEFLNNRGYSYLLRGDTAKASADLTRAATLDPTNSKIQDNLRLLDEQARRR